MTTEKISLYERLPWPVQSTLPIAGIVGVILKFHQTWNLNFMEFTGVTFCVITCFYLIFHTCRFIYENWIGILLRHNVDLTKFGKWAVVTGCTQGIGRAYVDALAKLGLNLVLMARSSEKLAQVEKEVCEAYQVDVKIIVVDFADGDRRVYKEIETQLKEMEVGILINNVGMCNAAPEYFLDLSRDFCHDLINCNMLSMTMMTSFVLPGMLQRKRGVVVTVGSLTGITPAPFLSLYGSSKAFVDRLTVALDLEYHDQGIIFQSLTPGYIATNMSKFKLSTKYVPTPMEFVDAAIKRVGLQGRTAVEIPHQILYMCLATGTYLRKDALEYVSYFLLH